MSNDSPGIVWQERKALIIGRAYPEPSKKHIETVCTGAITEDGELLRLYPISWRYLNENQQYRLWTWATFEVRKSDDDKRRESYRVREESISILSHVSSHAERFSLLQKAIFPDRETLNRRYREDWTSIGLVEIEMIEFRTSKPRVDWAEAKAYTKQSHLYVDVKPLDQAPLDMKLRFRCKNNPACKTHFCRLIGWEYMEAFRKFRVKYGSDAEGIAKIKEGIIKKFSDPAMSAFALTWDPFEIPCLDDWPALLLRKRLGTHVVLGSCSLPGGSCWRCLHNRHHIDATDCAGRSLGDSRSL